MAQVSVRLPSLLSMLVESRSSYELEATTVREALDALFRTEPALRVHIFSEDGELRPHVLCFLNERNTRWLEDLTAPTSDGDVITIMQAVSGG